MWFCLSNTSVNDLCKHPSTSLRVTVRLSEVEVCFVNYPIKNKYYEEFGCNYLSGVNVLVQ
jgi:hypothetical protein